MLNLYPSREVAARVASGLLGLTLFVAVGCKPQSGTPGGGSSTTVTPPTNQAPITETPKVDSAEKKPAATAAATDVKSARDRIEALGNRAKCVPAKGDLLTEIAIQDGSNLTAEDFELFGKLSDLKKLLILNCRPLNDEMAAKLSGLKGLTSLALTNSVISNDSVEMIVKSFPNLTDLDLSSNTNMSNGVIKILSEAPQLQRLTLVQNKVNDIGAQRLAKLTNLRALDLRGNMEAGDMALEVVSGLPKLVSFKHRSTAVGDTGLEYLSHNQTIESLLLQDFIISDQSGPYLAKLSKLAQLEIFRCQGFGSEGVLALKGMGLNRLTLRDLPNVDDRAMEVFDDLPKLKRLYLHELPTVSDAGLKHLEALKSLEQLDIWTVPQMTDASVEVIATLPALTDLTIRATAVTDASIDTILKMTNLQSLTFKENGSVTAEGLKKLHGRQWTKLDLGTSAASDEAAGQ